jgi:hypothetical protein
VTLRVSVGESERKGGKKRGREGGREKLPLTEMEREREREIL